MNNMKAINEADIGWLAGILDGEGTVALQVQGKEKRPKLVSFYNTDKTVMEKVIKILKDLDISYKCFSRFMNKEAKKPIITIRVSRIKHMKKLLEILLPHLTCKKENAIKILKYKSKLKTTGLPSLSYKDIYNIIKNFDRITPKELAKILDTNNNRTCVQLQRLRKTGLIERESFGVYRMIK
ncbi:MAG: hypothetical protein KJ906_04505 [Nanoarchaeota archaeon]|nr:hypothetical protein [Nanoarchaeota archaeon]